MPRIKTRNDFFLQEDYDSYKSLLELNAELATCSLTPDSRQLIAKLAEAVSYTAYSAGYANARFDAAENS